MPRNGDAFFTRMNAEQKGIFEKLRELHEDRSPPLSRRYEIGKHVNAWRDAVRQGKPGTFAQLAKELGSSSAQLVKAAKFAEEYTPAQAAKLEGRGVNWGLITATQFVAKKERSRLIDKVLTEKLSVADIALLIGKKKPHAGGRPPRKPPTPELALRYMKQLGGRWLKFHKKVWPKVCAALGIQDRGPAFLQLLAETTKVVAEVEMEAKKVQVSLAAKTAGGAIASSSS
jgi:hypothetical protein